MVDRITPTSLRTLLEDNAAFALIDVREAGEYNSTHIPGSSLLSRRLIESQVRDLVPFKGAHVIVCDDDGKRADLAAGTLGSMGYANVSVLDGGINRWTTEGYSTEWGSNVPSKDFGERMEVEYHVPEIEPTDLQDRIQRGDKLVILDTRTPEEYQRFCIPGGRSVPGGELALRITDIINAADQDTTVIVNCAGRTRSIIGTRALQRMGIPNLYGLKNGTSGWVLAGFQLQTGADHLDLPDPSAEGLEAAEAYADKVADQDKVGYLSIQELQDLMRKQANEPVYLVDVRTREEYERGHIPQFTWFPGGQAVQRNDDVVAIRNATIVFACDQKVRSSITASWYRQMGFASVWVVDGGTQAWEANGHALETGLPSTTPVGLEDALSKVKMISPSELKQAQGTTSLFVDTSRDFASGHVPGSHWIARGWLELQIAHVAPNKDTPLAVTCMDGTQSTLAGATLSDLGHSNVSVLNGGIAAWKGAGLSLEIGLSGVMIAPTDMVPTGPDRNYADMMNYLRWETALGEKYGP